MKKWIAGFLTVLLLLLLAACGTGSAGTGGSTQAIQPLYADELTDEKRAELIEALKQNDFIRSTAETVPGKGDEIIAGWDYYYTGTYNGYDTFFYMPVIFTRMCWDTNFPVW